MTCLREAEPQVSNTQPIPSIEGQKWVCGVHEGPGKDQGVSIVNEIAPPQATSGRFFSDIWVRFHSTGGGIRLLCNRFGVLFE